MLHNTTLPNYYITQALSIKLLAKLKFDIPYTS